MLALCSRRILIDNLLRSTALRPFSSSHVLLAKKAPNRNLRNYEIKIPLVHVVDPETQKLRDLAPIEDVIKDTNLKYFYVELVSTEPPVVKRVNRKEAHAAKKARKVRLKRTKVERKEVQMTWNAGDMDVAHKLRKAREHLAAGNLVDLAFAPKANQTWPPLHNMHRKLDSVLELLSDVALERRERTCERGVGVLFLRPVSAGRAEEGEQEET